MANNSYSHQCMPASIAILLVLMMAAVSYAAETRLSTRYYTIAGSTLLQIERQLEIHGPRLGRGSTHPGATRMEFVSNVEYEEKSRSCRVSHATVKLDIIITLPRWKNPHQAPLNVRQYWRALEADIQRHEKRHASIATDYANKLEHSLHGMTSRQGCAILERQVKTRTDRILAEHDRAHAVFDKREASQFSSRLHHMMKPDTARPGQATGTVPRR